MAQNQHIPFDKDAEEAVIGALLIDPDALPRVLSTGLEPTDFHLQHLGTIYRSILALHTHGQGIDLVTMSDALRHRGDEREANELPGLISACATSIHAEHYANIVKRCALQWRVIRMAGDMAKLGHGHTGTSAELTAAARELWNGMDFAGIEESSRRLPIRGADEILSTDWPEPIWAVPQYLPVGLGILAGRPKIGKSWLGLQLALSIGSGGVALGEQVERGRVLYLALEDPVRRIKDRMLLQGWPMGVQADFLSLGQFADEVGDLRNGGSERLAYQIAEINYRLVVIDTLSRSVGGDQSDVQQMTLALQPLQEMAHAYNCAVLMIDHHKKMMGTDFDAVADILGSTAKGAMADSIWGMYRQQGKSGVTLAITGRDIIEVRLRLKFDRATRAWQNEGDADAAKLNEHRQEIVAYLESSGEAGVMEIAKGIGLDKGGTHNHLRKLVESGQLHRIERGRRVFYTAGLPGF